ncbi:hypothetical protein [Galbibacter marinus]|nr:hypothetical protein [Galbibacter marinus]
MNDFISVIESALDHGYTVGWAADVSENILVGKTVLPMFQNCFTKI